MPPRDGATNTKIALATRSSPAGVAVPVGAAVAVGGAVSPAIAAAGAVTSPGLECVLVQGTIDRTNILRVASEYDVIINSANNKLLTRGCTGIAGALVAAGGSVVPLGSLLRLFVAVSAPHKSCMEPSLSCRSRSRIRARALALVRLEIFFSLSSSRSRARAHALDRARALVLALALRHVFARVTSSSRITPCFLNFITCIGKEKY
jgi:hypothetical protein